MADCHQTYNRAVNDLNQHARMGLGSGYLIAGIYAAREAFGPDLPVSLVAGSAAAFFLFMAWRTFNKDD